MSPEDLARLREEERIIAQCESTDMLTMADVRMLAYRLAQARAVVEAIRRQRAAAETWAAHMRTCSLCEDYYTEETGLCEVGAALVDAIPDWTETDAALAAHDAEAGR